MLLMVSVQSYNGEYFERGQLWYIVFAGIFGGLITLSLIYGNYVGAIVLILFIGGYLFFSAITTQPITLTVTQQSLDIGDKRYAWDMVKGFSFEVKTLKDGNEIKNIIFEINDKNYIHTFKDNISNIRDFVSELNNYTQLLHKTSFTTTESIARGLKL